MTSNSITPILIIGASRNGTTSLENMINSFPEVAAIEHKLHHGSHEAKLFGYYKYYGDLTDPDKYIDFLYHYSTEDYFQLAQGDIKYHLKNPQSNFFEFFYDLMDRYCRMEQKQFWTAKLDVAFFTDAEAFKIFNDTLLARYGDVKFIRIKRDFLPALLSAQYMEGENYSKRRKWPYKYYHLLAYTQSWFKAYLMETPFIDEDKVLSISFDNFINDKKHIQDKVREFLKLSPIFQSVHKKKTYPVNTSFAKKEKPSSIGAIDKYIARSYLFLLKFVPGIASFFHFLHYSIFRKTPSNPMHRKLLKYQYFKEDLMKEFEKKGAEGLLDSLK